MLSIGEFSHISQLTVKTLRYYQTLGILLPEKVDPGTGYRFYGDRSYGRAMAIQTLKNLGFSLKEIQQILEECRSDKELEGYIQNKLEEVRRKVKELRDLEKGLKDFRHSLAPADIVPESTVRESLFSLPLYAAREIFGKYHDIGKGYGYLFQKAGRSIKGKGYAFYYTMEYVEEDARMDAVLELKRPIQVKGIREASITDWKVVSLIHKGPYGTQGAAYLQLFDYCRKKGYTPIPPIIEHHLKGPGMIFKGNPDEYLTECFVRYE